MGELSAPAFDMMPDTTVSPMPEKISSPAPVAVLEEPAAEIQPEISGGFYAGYFSTRNRRRRHRFGTYCRIGTGQRRIKAGRKNTKKRKTNRKSKTKYRK